MAFEWQKHNLEYIDFRTDDGNFVSLGEMEIEMEISIPL